MIIGIGGGLESGKSTVAGFICEKPNYIEMSFAKNLKIMCMEIFNLTEDQCFTTEGKQEVFDKPIMLTSTHVADLVAWIHEKNRFEFSEIDIPYFRKFVNKMEFTTPREVLQKVGTELCRGGVSPNFHVDVVYREINEKQLKDVVISDARFFNERAYIKEKGGVTLLVVNTKDNNDSDERFAHGSEVEIGTAKDYDTTIFNAKNSLLVLKEQTETAFKILKMT